MGESSGDYEASGMDAADRLALELYGRKARAVDLLGGSNAQILADAAAKVSLIPQRDRRTALNALDSAEWGLTKAYRALERIESDWSWNARADIEQAGKLVKRALGICEEGGR